VYTAVIKQRDNRKLKLQQQLISQKNAALNHLVNEKEWLIKEIHHRVKNNFHMVMGLLDTQAGYLKNEEALAAIKESQHRIQAMAFIHQKLYQTTNLSTVEMSAYIHELVDYLRHSFNAGQQISFRLEIENQLLDLSHALPIALILNEAITNSIKYGFPNRRMGVISVSFEKDERDRRTLNISDNGVGMPPGFNYDQSDSMGMKLIRGLCEDIHGDLEIINAGGTTISISFPYDSLHRTETSLQTSKPLTANL
jgi:two-component sensor histidine kinase